MIKLTGEEVLKKADLDHLKPGNLVIYKNVPFVIEEEPESFIEQGRLRVGGVKLMDAEYGYGLPILNVHHTELFKVAH